jgi:Ca2+-transporting ATPase
MALCNDAEMEDAVDGAEAVATGDPTETALAAAAGNHGFQKRELEAAMPRIMEAPFDSERKRMTTVHRIERNPIPDDWTPRGHVVAFTKGSMESVLSQCSQLISAGIPAALHDDTRNELMKIGEDLAANGMRVLGVALREFDAPPEQSSPELLETGLIFCGLCAMIDPPRPEVRDAVRLCKSAGIRPIMITGDHPLTALHIAAELGIAPRDGQVVTGTELATMDAARLREVVTEVSVFARVAPQSKLDIVAALQANDQVVAMTGDGVNDAPALKKANIGIAMGITGTDVSKEASDMVLLDDNFATIVAAVAEGRTIYDNIRKFIKYLMTTNVGELWVMLAAPFLGMPLPLMPLQILWMNLVTDGLPALALGVEPAEADVMRRPPTRPNESIFAHGMGVHIVWVGLLMAVIALGAGYSYWRVEPSGYGEATRWQTMVFTVLTLSQMANVMAIRAGRASLFTAGIFTNRPLVLAVAATFLLQVAILYVPVVQTFFRTVALSVTDFLIALALSTIVFVAVEIEKWIARAKASRLDTPDVAAEA